MHWANQWTGRSGHRSATVVGSGSGMQTGSIWEDLIQTPLTQLHKAVKRFNFLFGSKNQIYLGTQKMSKCE